MRLLILLFLISGHSFANKKIDRLWKARSLQAHERIKELQEKNGDSRGKNLTGKESCEWIAENAFYPFSLSGEEFSAFREKNKEMDIYKLLLFKERGKNITQINVGYLKSGEVLAGVVKLGEGWVVAYSKESLGSIALTGPGCAFLIPLSDPLDIKSQEI